jgi:hypothetical protein
MRIFLWLGKDRYVCFDKKIIIFVNSAGDLLKVIMIIRWGSCSQVSS